MLLGTPKQRQEVFEEDQNETFSWIIKFIRSISTRNQNTAKQYHARLLLFEKFVDKKYKVSMDNLIQQLKNKEYDPYYVLNDYCIFLQNNYNFSSVTIRDKIITVKTFLEYNDIELSPKKFKLKIRFPKTIKMVY